MFDLRSFLRRAPKPVKLRIRTSEDEERIIELGATRRRWHAAEEAVKTAGAVSVECLAADGTILRAQRLRDPDDDEAAEDDKNRYEEKLLAKDRREMAAMLDRYGARMGDAFRAGAEAASVSQEHLVALVETLTANLSVAIVNVHNMASNIAGIIQSNAETVAQLQGALASGGEGQSGDALKLLMTALASRGQAPPAPPAPPNGKGHK